MDLRPARLSDTEAEARAAELVRMVGIPADRLRAFPHELSGGMRQRATIALALACDPELVVMDEPTTAVDVVMQRQILRQVQRLQGELGFAIVFITHLRDPPPGCAFHPRCPKRFAPCDTDLPQLLQPIEGRQVACHLHDPAVHATGRQERPVEGEKVG